MHIRDVSVAGGRRDLESEDGDAEAEEGRVGR